MKSVVSSVFSEINCPKTSLKIKSKFILIKQIDGIIPTKNQSELNKSFIF